MICAAASCLLVVVAPSPAAADGPTSSTLSLIGARTLPQHTTLVSGEVGWPGAYAGVHLAPSSRSSLGFVGGVVYGSPFMSFASAIGGQLEARGRLHVYGQDNLDAALALALGGVVGEGALVGERGFFANDLGYGGYAEPAVLASFAVSRTLTLNGGVFGLVGLVTVPDRGDSHPSHWLGGAGVKLSVETLLSRDVLLFAQLVGGIGFKAEGQFDDKTILRLSLGAAYSL